MKLNRNLTIAFFVFLTLSIGLVSTNSASKSVYAQSNALSQNGGGNDADQDIEQAQKSNQDNQVVSGYSSILSGNNLLCHHQDNLQVSDESCNSDGVLNDRQLDLIYVIQTTEESPRHVITIEQFNQDRVSIAKSSEIMTDNPYSIIKMLEDRTDSLKLTIDGFPRERTVFAEVIDSNPPIDCDPIITDRLICTLDNLLSTSGTMEGEIEIFVEG